MVIERGAQQAAGLGIEARGERLGAGWAPRRGLDGRGFRGLDAAAATGAVVMPAAEAAPDGAALAAAHDAHANGTGAGHAGASLATLLSSSAAWSYAS